MKRVADERTATQGFNRHLQNYNLLSGEVKVIFQIYFSLGLHLLSQKNMEPVEQCIQGEWEDTTSKMRILFYFTTSKLSMHNILLKRLRWNTIVLHYSVASDNHDKASLTKLKIIEKLERA